MIKCQTVINAMERLAPRYLAEEWDNVGLLVGSGQREVNRILTCLDVTEEVADRAVAGKVDMIIAHHPLIFRPLKNIATDTQLGRILQKLLAADIAVYAAHTNLDTAVGGTNDLLAELLELQEVKPLVISHREEIVKLGVNVPKEQAEAVRRALGKAGAGNIDNYSDCSFVYEGKGYFTPGEGSHPFLGSWGVEEQVEEVRIETVMPVRKEKSVVKAMLKAHPYEVPAYDLYPTRNTAAELGMGRIGRLAEPVELETLLKKLSEVLPTNTLRWIHSNSNKVQKIALCTGAGAEFIRSAKFQGADTFITGDVKYHEGQLAQELGVNLIDAGHFGTEYPVAERLAGYLEDVKQAEKWQVEILADDFSRDIFNTFA